MPATLLNVPARPRLTVAVILVLSMALAAVVAFVFAIRGSGARRDVSTADRPAFTRRIETLPAVVVNAPGTEDVSAAAGR